MTNTAADIPPSTKRIAPQLFLSVVALVIRPRQSSVECPHRSQDRMALAPDFQLTRVIDTVILVNCLS